MKRVLFFFSGLAMFFASSALAFTDDIRLDFGLGVMTMDTLADPALVDLFDVIDADAITEKFVPFESANKPPQFEPRLPEDRSASYAPKAPKVIATSDIGRSYVIA